MGITGGKAASSAVTLVVESEVPTTKTSLYSLTNVAATKYFSITIPNGVSVICVDIESQNYDDTTYAWLYNVDNENDWGYCEDWDGGGSASEIWYVKVTAGKTYNLCLEGDYYASVDISYSTTINSCIPDFTDL